MTHTDGLISLTVPHRLRITRNVFAPTNETLSEIWPGQTSGGDSGGGVPGGRRIAVFVDDGLAEAQPQLLQRVRQWFALHPGSPRLAGLHTLPGGERAKNGLEVWQHIVHQIIEANVDRQSFVMAIGGGAALDVVGFAAATVHRGLRMVRVATTTLAQADSAVGIKCGVNLRGVKNMLGSFAVPWAVINDTAMLDTLPERDWRAGFAEAVKVALIKDTAFFEEIARWVEAIRYRDEPAYRIIARSAELHYQHILSGGDPFELGSARPLDLGHWSAHKLESMSGYEIAHGEAVAIGVALDAMYAAELGHMTGEQARRVCHLLTQLGFSLEHPLLADVQTLYRGLEEFREHMGGRLTLVLPRGIGGLIEVHEVDRGAMDRAIKGLRQVHQ